MTRTVDIVDPLDCPDWDDRLLSHQGYTFFHGSAWARVLIETYHYRPFYLALRDGGRLAALLPLMEVDSPLTGIRGVSLPFTDYCEPVGNASLGERDVVAAVKTLAHERGWDHVELRGGGYCQIPPATSFLVHAIDLGAGIDEAGRRLAGSTRRNIEKAIREGVVAHVYRSREALREYYLLHCITRRRHGLPPQPYAFFENVHRYILAGNSGFIVLASHAQRNIAGAVYFCIGKKSLYKFGASDYRYQHLRPNNLAMWEAIRWCAENGYQSLGLGRTAIGNGGLRRFKLGWGATERIVPYYRYDTRHDSFVTNTPTVNRHCRWIFKRMPMPLLKAVGSSLYKHVG